MSGGQFMNSISRFGKLLLALQVLIIVSVLIATRFDLGGQTPPVGVISNESRVNLTHISTDKPIYRSGEKVYVRAVVLSASGHSPMPGQPFGVAATATFEIKGPRGDTVTKG